MNGEGAEGRAWLGLYRWMGLRHRRKGSGIRQFRSLAMWARARWLAEHGSAIIGSKKGNEIGERRNGKKGPGPADGRDPWGSEGEGGGVRAWALKAERVWAR